MGLSFTEKVSSYEVHTANNCGEMKENNNPLSDGLSYKLIAANLFINYETVHSHIKNIYQKLHVNSINEAVSIALKNKIV